MLLLPGKPYNHSRATDNAGNTKDATITVTVHFQVSDYTSIYSVSGAGGQYHANLNTGGLRREQENGCTGVQHLTLH